MSDSAGWALGAAPCSSGPQCAAIIHTTDSGAGWGTIAAPPAVVQNGNGRIDCFHASPCVGSLRFGSATDGYAYGPSLFHTIDAGRSWQAEPDSLPTLKLEYAGAAAFRILGYGQTLDCFGGCKLQRAMATGRPWLDAGPVIRMAGADVVPEGSQRIYVFGYANPAGGAQNKKATVYLSRDAGSSWQQRADPCPGDSFAIGAATAPIRHLMVLCQSLNGSSTSVVRSDDAGQTFGAEAAAPVQYEFTAGSATTFSGVNTTSGLEVETTLDGGGHWRTTKICPGGASPGNQVLALGYQDSSTAHLICPENVISRSHDGGVTWTDSTVSN